MNATPTRPSNYKDWTLRGTPTLNAEQSFENENITTLIACTGVLCVAATRHVSINMINKINKENPTRPSNTYVDISIYL
jgi:hypothetical protein